MLFIEVSDYITLLNGIKMRSKKQHCFCRNKIYVTIASCFLFSACNNYFKNDYADNSPTSGKLKVYYDEGLERQLENQEYTFEAFYPNAEIITLKSNNDEAIQALYQDSCEAIFTSRNLNQNERKAFESRSFFIKPTPVAKSGVMLITNINSPINRLTFEQIFQLLSKDFAFNDAIGNSIKMKALLDRNNSGIIHYLRDSILKGKSFSANCFVSKSTVESINYVANNLNTVAFIDFAWLSDVDDSLVIANQNKIKTIPVSKPNSNNFETPCQSSFKLGTYPFITTLYVIKKTGEFSLAKGFETFVAGPKGQNAFLKQGLLPTKQQERSIEVKIE